ncbi:MAG: hypothetical protein IJ242_01205, partial [Clostridia bacterium]|nr:hypothetical protein [Clostridia bacterium]
MNFPSTEAELRKRNRAGFLRLVLFGLCFLFILALANFNLIETDLISGSTVREMQSRDDIDIAFVGSSVVLYHFNPEIIREETGLTAFNCAIHSASLQGDTAITEELYKTSHPKWIVLVLEPYVLNTAKESIEAECRMAPFLTGFKTFADYYLRNTRIDHLFVDRAFIPRTMYPHSIHGLLKTFTTKNDYKKALEVYVDDIKPSEHYIGSGFVRHDPDPETLNNDLRNVMYREPFVGDYYPLLPDTIRLLSEYRSMVEKNGAQLLVVLCPNHTSHPLAVPSFLPYTQSLMVYCQENGIPCFNFLYAKEELMPCLDDYFFDVYHMSGEGADILTRAFCRVFNSIQDGTDVSGLFYQNSWLYQDSLHTLTNTWLW